MASQCQYSDLSTTQNHRDDESTTEVESLVGLEKDWAASNFEGERRRSRRNICILILHAVKWIFVITLQIAILGLLIRDQGLLRTVGLSKGRSSSAREVGGDMTGWGPHSKRILHKSLSGMKWLTLRQSLLK
jgi:hypothetical protein